MLTVVSYYRGSTLVGQSWWGCPNQPGGDWGEASAFFRLSAVPC